MNPLFVKWTLLTLTCVASATAHAQSGIRVTLPWGYVPPVAAPAYTPDYLPAYPGSLPGTLPGVPGVQPSLMQWCNDITTYLSNEKMRAMLFAQQENFPVAKQILVQALVEAAQSLSMSPELRAPITLTLVQRGTRIASALNSMATPGTLGEISMVSFLADWVQFVIDAESSIDVPYFIPYHYQYGRCASGCGAGFDMAYFQRLYVRLAQDQLNFVVDHMTRETDRGVFPYGDPRFFLKTAEIMSREVAFDLSRNLDAYAHACSIKALQRLSTRLARFNQGDVTIYPGGMPWAVSAARSELLDVSSALSGTSCY